MMPKLYPAIAAMLLLFAISSCKNQEVGPITPPVKDSVQVEAAGWTQLHDYPGNATRWTFGFAAGGKGYVVGGQYEKASDGSTAPVYQYDVAANNWTRLNDYPGDGMGLMAGFTVNNKTYLGTGFNYSTNLLADDFWEYDHTTDTWTKRADFPGGKRQGAISFSIAGNGYLIGGLLRAKQDTWQYAAGTDQWTQMADYPGTGIAEMIGVGVNGKAYVGGGTSSDEVVSDFWEYDPLTDTWAKKADIIEPLYNPVTFTKAGKIFVIGGISQNLSFRKQVLMYDIATDKWTKVEDFKGQERSAAVGFVIGNTAYFGLGAGTKTAGGAKYPAYFNDFWKYNP